MVACSFLRLGLELALALTPPVSQRAGSDPKHAFDPDRTSETIEVRWNRTVKAIDDLKEEEIVRARSSSADNGKNASSAEGVGITTADLCRAAWASSLGSALEYYDFALYSLASALIFGPLFFPEQDPAIGRIASFVTYFIGFAVRPVGGIVFGILGDRLGRKFTLVTTIALIGAASTLIGLPTYASVGYWAPIMLVGLRLLQGLGAGAEQAGASVLMTEYAPRKGVASSLRSPSWGSNWAP